MGSTGLLGARPLCRGGFPTPRYGAPRVGVEGTSCPDSPRKQPKKQFKAEDVTRKQVPMAAEGKIEHQMPNGKMK